MHFRIGNFVILIPIYFNILLNLFILYVWIFCLYVCLFGAQGDQKRDSDPLDWSSDSCRSLISKELD